MPTYVMLARWTDQGARTIEDSPKRLDAARKSLEDMGGSFTSVYMTMGAFDLVITSKAPDDAVAARFAVLLGKQGSRPRLPAGVPSPTLASPIRMGIGDD